MAYRVTGTGTRLGMVSFAMPIPALTISLWINRIGGGNVVGITFSNGTADNFRFSSVFRFYKQFSGGLAQWTGSQAIPAIGVTFHLAMTYDGSNTTNKPTFYLDGVAMSTTTDVAPVGTISTTGTSSYFFNNSGGTQSYQINADDIRFYNRVLSAEEVYSVAKRQGMDENVNGLQRIYNFKYSTQGSYPDFNDLSRNKGSFGVYSNGTVAPTCDYTKFITNRKRRRA